MVVATGTTFSVELLKAQVRVVLYEGHVAGPVAGRPDAGRNRSRRRAAYPGPSSCLRPGARSSLKPAVADGGPGARRAQSVAAALYKRPADPVRSLAWEEGQLAFQDEPLSVVAERMNRYSAVPLRIADRRDSGSTHLRRLQGRRHRSPGDRRALGRLRHPRPEPRGPRRSPCSKRARLSDAGGGRPWAHRFGALAVAALCLCCATAHAGPTPADTLPSDFPAAASPQAESPQAPTADFVVREAMIRMRDGVGLHTLIVMRQGLRDAPILLERTPYGCRRPAGEPHRPAGIGRSAHSTRPMRTMGTF